MSYLFKLQAIAAILLSFVLIFVGHATIEQSNVIRERNLILVDQSRVLNEQNALLRSGCRAQ